VNFLVDENMPRTLAPQIADLGFTVQDVRDIDLRARPDSEVMDTAIAADAIINYPRSRLCKPQNLASRIHSRHDFCRSAQQYSRENRQC
jgi:Domain of unknown function (DUF5615)